MGYRSRPAAKSSSVRPLSACSSASTCTPVTRAALPPPPGMRSARAIGVATGRATTPASAGSQGTASPWAGAGDVRRGAPEWGAWMRDLGRRQRGLREFLGLSQERLARLAGVSQGAVSRLEVGKGLATPLLVVLKVNAVLASEVGKLDPTLVGAALRAAIQLQATLTPSRSVLGLNELP